MLETPTVPHINSKGPPQILSLIGDTPLVEVTQFDTGPCQLFLKLENQNPGGSIKDRIALSMIEAAEDEGKLQPGGTVVEATAGNTGLGLALRARMSRPQARRFGSKCGTMLTRLLWESVLGGR